jgi:hypothetical protein
MAQSRRSRGLTGDPRRFPSPSQELLLRAALLEGDRAAEAWREWRREPRLDPASQRLLPQLYRNLSGQGLLGEELAALHDSYRKTWSQNRLRLRETADVLRSLSDRGIETLLLKGAALIPLAYRDYGARPMTDVDLLVRPERALDALALLGEMGYRSMLGRPEALIGVRHADELGDRSGRKIDLHWAVLQENCRAGADEELWRSSIGFELDGFGARSLCPSDLLLHLLVHGARPSPVQPVSWVADAVLLLRAQQDDLDWPRLVEQASARRLSLPLATGLAYLSRFPGLTIPSETLDALASPPPTRFELLEYRLKTRPHPILGTLPALWLDYGRLDSPPRLRLRGFARYLQVTFHLKSRRQLPLELTRLTARRLLGRQAE